ncbi:MAG: zf-HC2 protein [Paenibacillaceae bacterium]|jgi:hypothetical protein|nr:zf-HC2 protein [Paenibacillaceae bacterium]
MKCEDIQERLGIYFDLPEEDEDRIAVDEHIRQCETCREEFRIWEESADLIRLSHEEIEPVLYSSPMVTDQVMKRIYQQEAWRTPIPNRIYSISFALRRKLTVMAAFFVALFLVSFLHTAYNTQHSAEPVPTKDYGINQAAKATINPADSLNVHSMPNTTMASVSPTIIDPVKIGPLRSIPDYMLSLSILGLISTLLIMNWLSRTRA